MSSHHQIETVHDPLDERQFSLAVCRLADSLSYGSDTSPFLGAGIEYVQSRLYVPGDPVKTMDWKVTGRTGKFHVKEYEAPKRMPIYILLDTSASMCVSSQKMSKYAWATQIAAGLALAAQQRLSPVGLLGCGERELHVQPTLSRTEVLKWSHHIRRFHLDEATTLGYSLRRLCPSLVNRALLIVLSDLHDPDAIPALKLAHQEHDVVVLQLQDPAERGRIGGGIFRTREAESDREFVSHGRSTWLDFESQHREMKQAGIHSLLLRTDRPFLHALRYFLRHRDSLGRGR